jgi:ATP-dependent Clp protease ATP-binding subunit ClpA
MALKRAFEDETLAIFYRANEIAIRDHHSRVDLAHVLLAMIEIRDPVIDQLFKGQGDKVELVRARGIRTLAAYPKEEIVEFSNKLTFTSRMEEVIELAEHESNKQKAKLISPAHLMIALSEVEFFDEAEREAASERILAPLGLAPYQIRRLLQTRNILEKLRSLIFIRSK